MQVDTGTKAALSSDPVHRTIKRMTDVNPFTFNLMLLAQRVDEALRHERLRSRQDPFLLPLLRLRKRRLRARLRRSLASPMLAGS